MFIKKIAAAALVYTSAAAAAQPGAEYFPPLGAAVSQSVALLRLSDGKSLYALNADQDLSPASVTKVVTSAAALSELGSSFRFLTRFYIDGRREGGTVHGNLIVVGSGDPFIVNEKLWQLAADFHHLGLSEITGDIIIDNSLFRGPVRDASRQGTEKASSHAYDAPVSAFSVNFNTFALAYAPGSRVGSPALVALDPYAIRGLVLDNSLRTIAGAAVGALEVSRLTQANGLPKLVVRGSLGAEQGLRKIYRSVDDPILAAGETLRAFLREEHIQVRGRVRAGTKPSEARLFYELQGFDLGYIVSGLNAFSNNYIADMLVQRLGAEAGVDNANASSIEAGVSVLSRFMREDVGIKTRFVLKNGSGLDTDNRLSANDLVQVLQYMEKQFSVFPEFLASLPLAGAEGTMKKRLHGAAQQGLLGKIRAKTGTLSAPIAVASLAGYLRHPRHGLVAFAIIENGVLGKEQPGLGALRERQDLALQKLWQAL